GNIKPDVTRSTQDERQGGNHSQHQPPKPAPGSGLHRVYKEERSAVNPKQCEVLGQTRLGRFELDTTSAGQQRADDFDDVKFVIAQQWRKRTKHQQESDERSIERQRIDASREELQRAIEADANRITRQQEKLEDGDIKQRLLDQILFELRRIVWKAFR